MSGKIAITGLGVVSAAGGNVAQIRAAVPAVGGSCKSCHDTFKGDK